MKQRSLLSIYGAPVASCFSGQPLSFNDSACANMLHTLPGGMLEILLNLVYFGLKVLLHRHKEVFNFRQPDIKLVIVIPTK